jgi:3-dehydroquinate synthase
VYHALVDRLSIPSARGDYAVVVGRGLLSALDETIDREVGRRAHSVATDRTVGALYGRRAAAGLGCGLIELPGGEPDKAWPAVERLCQRWLADGLDRRAAVLALGGGIVTDTVGFAAAVYLRGIDWVAAPTTLLAMVDASVGGKTGVNLPEGKNLVGAFWPPCLVLVDVETLQTLPDRELRAGLAEAVKTAWIGDNELLGLLPPAGDVTFPSMPADAWCELVVRCIRVKADIVADDEREAGARAALNLGHTLGHALEAATGYGRFLHGEAVAWGLLAAGRLARERQLLSAGRHADLVEAVARLGPVPGIADMDPDLIIRHMVHDKKKGAAGIGWVLPTDRGVVLDQHVDITDVVAVIQHYQEAGFSPSHP